jgi:hypothetical protein
MVSYSKQKVDEIKTMVQGWTNPNDYSNLEKSLVKDDLNSVDENKLMVEELTKFQSKNQLPTKVGQKLNEIIKSYDAQSKPTEKVEVYQDAKEILNKYISANLPKVARDEISKKLETLEEVKTKKHILEIAKVKEFRDDYLTPSLQKEFDNVLSKFNIAKVGKSYENKSMDEMVDYFISQGEDFPANSPKESLEKLKAKKGEDAVSMTFSEAVKKYNKTGEKCWNTTNNNYLRFPIENSKKIMVLSGEIEMPNNYETLLNLYSNLKQGKDNNGNPVEVLVGDDINTKNATKHNFAVIIDDKLEESGRYKTKDWIKNTFVKAMNGGELGLAELAKGYAYDELGSWYNFKKSNDGKFEVGCPVHLDYLSDALDADYVDYNGQFRG